MGAGPGCSVVVTEAVSSLRLIDSCITQLNAQGPSRTCNESKEEAEEAGASSLPRSSRYDCRLLSQAPVLSGELLTCLQQWRQQRQVSSTVGCVSFCRQMAPNKQRKTLLNV
jgi:hypothetical protein